MRHSLLVLLGAACLVAPGVPGAESSKKASCKKCRGTGRVPCRAHDRRSRSYRPYCSACKGVPSCCKGVGWTPCAACADEGAQEAFEAAQAVLERERRGEGFYPWGEGLFLAACEHYRFRARATHAECHEFHAVAEKAFGLFRRLFGDEGVEQLQWDEKGHFLIVYSRDQYLQFIEWYRANRNAPVEQLEFLRQSKALFLNNERLQVIIRSEQNRKLLLHRIAHGAGHLAIENYKVFRSTPEWFSEGWAARSEIEALRDAAIYCVNYVGGGTQDRPPQKWRKTVRDAVRTRKAPPLERLFAMKLGGMGALEWAMCVSLVSWLVDRYPERTVKIVDAFKGGTGSKEALEAAFDSPLAKIEKAWKVAALAQ